MKTKTTLTLLATAVLLAGTAVVTARGFGYGPGGGLCMPGGPGFGGPARMLQLADADKDGIITRAEAQAVRDGVFAKFDTDKSGTVNASEIDAGLTTRFDAMKTRARYRLLSRFDTDGDGQISKDEFGKNALLRFDRADVNNDGKITADEMRNRRMGRRGMGMRRGGRKGYGHPGMMRGRGGPGMWNQGRGQGFMGGPGMGFPNGYSGGYPGGPNMMPPWGGMPPATK